MHKSFYSSLILVILLLTSVFPALGKSSPDEFIRLLPKDLGGFRQVGGVRPTEAIIRDGLLGPQAAGQSLAADRHYSMAEVEYLSSGNSRFLVEVVRFPRDSDAYSLLTVAARSARNPAQSDLGQITREVGTASVILPGRVAFFKGITFVRVTATQTPAQGSDNEVALARLLADRLEEGEADIPVLVKHLPRWEQVQGRLIYLAGFRSLRAAFPDQPILESVISEGDADAVAAQYGAAQFVIVEFNTPQLAGDNDRSVLAKIEELRTQSQPVPSAYRRVGNYSVFVFNAANEQAANELIDQVEYEQVVQWLGDNPYMLEKAQREYYETTAGVLVAVVKASGLSLLLCLAAGGFIGALLFSRRRAQQRQCRGVLGCGRHAPPKH